jgi:predicted ATPase
VIAYLADKSALLILDNCEHLIDACAAFVEAFLAAAGRSVILATSREALGVDGEQVLQLASLCATSSGAADSAAVQLFVERAASIAPDFCLDAGNQATIQAFATALGHRRPLRRCGGRCRSAAEGIRALGHRLPHQRTRRRH